MDYEVNVSPLMQGVNIFLGTEIIKNIAKTP